MAFDCQELLRSILDPETTHTLYDGQWMMVVDDGVMVVVGGDDVEVRCAGNQKMVQRLTRSTFTGGRVKSGDRGLASPARQSPIPCSGSFTEACTVSSEGQAWLGKALLASLRWQGLGGPRARRARGNTGGFGLR